MTSSKTPPNHSDSQKRGMDSSDDDLRDFLDTALNKGQKQRETTDPFAGSGESRGPTAPPRKVRPIRPQDLKSEMRKMKAEMSNRQPDPGRVKVTGNPENSAKQPDDDSQRFTSSDIFGDVINEIEGQPKEEPHFKVSDQKRKQPPVQRQSDGENFLQSITEDTDQYSKTGQPATQAQGAPKLPPNEGGQAAKPSPKASADQAMAGTNEYQLLNKIASGGMAEVWKAKLVGEKGFEKIVAIKKILGHLGDNEEFISMFIDEARVAANLTHPNIAQIYELGKMGDSFFIAMEYVSGQNLRTLLNQCISLGISMAPEIVAFIGMKLCNALHYAHQKKDYDNHDLKIVHRDVSPQNILISSEGEIKLVDFGIAKASIKASETIAGSLKGKLLYMSPEQADGKPIDRRSDIFSLGSVMYECLTGRKIFGGDSELSILKNVRTATYTPARDVNPHIPEGLDAILQTVLAMDPNQRYASAKHLENDLKNFLKQERYHINEADVAEYARLVVNKDVAKLAAYGPAIGASSGSAASAGAASAAAASAGAAPAAAASAAAQQSPSARRPTPPPPRRTGRTHPNYRPPTDTKPQTAPAAAAPAAAASAAAAPTGPRATKKSGVPWLAVVLVLLALGLAGGGYWYMTRSTATNTSPPQQAGQDVGPADTSGNETADILAPVEPADSTDIPPGEASTELGTPADSAANNAATGDGAELSEEDRELKELEEALRQKREMLQKLQEEKEDN